MKSFGNINISNSYIENIINNYSVSDTEDKKKNDVEEEEEADHTEVVEVLPVHTSDNSNSGIIRFFAQRSKAQPILSWLHDTTDDLETPKERLLNIRAVYEAGHFTQRIPYKVYVEEFGPITKSRYSHWMGEELNYSRKDIDDIIDLFPF